MSERDTLSGRDIMFERDIVFEPGSAEAGTLS
jgi:hypothetical protein